MIKNKRERKRREKKPRKGKEHRRDSCTTEHGTVSGGRRLIIMVLIKRALIKSVHGRVYN